MTSQSTQLTAPLSSTLRRLGIDLESDIQQLWNLFAKYMDTEEDKAACCAVGKEMKSRHMVLFVENMLSLTRDEITDVICNCGGKATWLRALEHLLGHEFYRLSSNAPLSARLAIGWEGRAAQGCTPSSSHEATDLPCPSLPPSPPDSPRRTQVIASLAQHCTHARWSHSSPACARPALTHTHRLIYALCRPAADAYLHAS